LDGIDTRDAADRRLIEFDRARGFRTASEHRVQFIGEDFEISPQFFTLCVYELRCRVGIHSAESTLSMPHRRLLLIMALGAVLACHHEDRELLRLGHGLDQNHPVHRAMLVMADEVARRSAGRLRIEVYPSEQLGSERECLELLQIGSLAMTKVSAAVLENFSPDFRIFGVPYLFRDDAHRFAVLEGPIGRELLIGLEPVRLRGLVYYDSGSRSFYTRDRPILTPEDLAGLKIRVQESPTAIAMVRAFGAAATPIAWGELYTALQQGVVDGAENNPPSFHLSRHYEVAGYYSLDEHTSVPDVLLVSDTVLRRLDAQEKEWLQAAADISAQVQKSLWQEASRKALQVAAQAGVEIVHPDKHAFREAARAMRRRAPLDARIAELAGRIARVEQ